MASSGPQKLILVMRTEWGAETGPGEPPPSPKHPVTYLRYGYTVTEECITRDECIEQVRQYQQKYIGRNEYDQPYNFLIGGDGAVYEGRGWNVEADRPSTRENRKVKGKCIDIAYIGDYNMSFPKPVMLRAAAALVRYGVDKKLIKELPRVLDLHDFREPFDETSRLNK